MAVQQLEREYHVLKAVARRSVNPSQQRALEYQLKELEQVLSRKRGCATE
jgi:hypothetical protein